ncbi:MAG: hypothetical protein ACRD5B_17175, partial [Nitrososphaeraceae archaeon]
EEKGKSSYRSRHHYYFYWDASENSDESAHRNQTAKVSAKMNNAPVCTIISTSKSFCMIMNANYMITTALFFSLDISACLHGLLSIMGCLLICIVYRNLFTTRL